MFHFDRIYGQLIFPPLIQSVLDCPGLLRLREVGMANVPFISFPSFAAVSRYEHSLGVSHLAGVFAENLKLSEKEKMEVMLAALYHDVATPPFAHAVEEILNERYGYDHERKIQELIVGGESVSGGQKNQLFLGRGLKIHRVCQSKEGRRLKLDALRIADFSTGKEGSPLGNIICSEDIDLDNIDNVIRAATAMGMREVSLDLPEMITRSLILTKDGIFIDEPGSMLIQQWQNIRKILYGMIFSSVRDFALQTMLKDAVRNLPERSIGEADWCLTDSQLIYDKLLKYKKSAEIVNRMRLGKLYRCLAFLIIEGNIPFPIRETILETIRKESAKIYKCFFKRALDKEDISKVRPNISVNYYVDKRVRSITKNLVFFNRKTEYVNQSKDRDKLIIGVFTSNNRVWDISAIEELKNKISIIDSKFKVFDLKVDYATYPNLKIVKRSRNDIFDRFIK